MIFGLPKVKIKSIMVKDSIMSMIDVQFLSQTVKALVMATTTKEEVIQNKVAQVETMGLMEIKLINMMITNIIHMVITSNTISKGSSTIKVKTRRSSNLNQVLTMITMKETSTDLDLMTTILKISTLSNLMPTMAAIMMKIKSNTINRRMVSILRELNAHKRMIWFNQMKLIRVKNRAVGLHSHRYNTKRRKVSKQLWLLQLHLVKHKKNLMIKLIKSNLLFQLQNHLNNRLSGTIKTLNNTKKQKKDQQHKS